MLVQAIFCDDSEDLAEVWLELKTDVEEKGTENELTER